MKTLIICLLFGVCFGQLFDVYVSPDGTDNGTCGRTQSTPCQTMAGALQVVPERKVPVINLQPGEYTGPNNINQTYPVGTIIQGYNGIHSEYETIFDCTGGTDTVFYFPSTASVYNIVMKNCAYGVVFETPNPEDFLKVKHVNSYTCGTAFHISGGRFNISYTNVNTSSIGIHIENAYENCLIYSYSAFNVLQSILLESSANVQFLSITIVVLESSGGMMLHGNPDTYISINFAQFDMITSTTCIEVTCGKFLIRNSLFNNANTKGISFTGDEQSSFTVQSSQFFEISVGIEYAGDGIFEISGPKFYNISSSPVVIHSGTKGEIYNIWVYNAPNPTVIDTPTPIYLNITDCYFSNSSGIVANLVKESVVYLISPVFQHTNGRVLDARGGFWYIDEAYVSQTGIVQGNGGAFYLQNSANFDIATFLFYNLVVVEATATGYGGAIYLDGSKLSMHYGYLQSNVAKQGGAIYGVDFVEVVIVDVLFENNVATQMGGALAFDNSDTSNANVSLVNTQFTDNYAREGSVVYCCFPTGSCGVTLDIVNGISLSGNVNFIPGGEDIDCETNGYYFTHSEG